LDENAGEREDRRVEVSSQGTRWARSKSRKTTYVSDLHANDETLLLWAHDVEHRRSTDESSRSERNRELVASSVVVSKRLRFSFRNSESVEGGDLGRREIVQSGVDVPSLQ